MLGLRVSIARPCCGAGGGMVGRGYGVTYSNDPNAVLQTPGIRVLVR